MNARALIAVGALLAAFIFGWSVNGWRWDGRYTALQLDHSESVREAQAQAAEITRLRQSRSDAIADAVLSDLTAERAAAESVEQEVRDYESDDNRTVLDRDWVRIHDAAAVAMPGDPDAPGGSDAGPVRAAHALRVVAWNYRQHRECRARLTRLQQWAEGLTDEGNR